MDLIVAKFGGTSVGNGGRIKKAAESIAKEYKKGKEKIYSPNDSSMETSIIQATNEKSTYRTSICLNPRYKCILQKIFHLKIL